MYICNYKIIYELFTHLNNFNYAIQNNPSNISQLNQVDKDIYLGNGLDFHGAPEWLIKANFFRTQKRFNSIITQW